MECVWYHLWQSTLALAYDLPLPRMVSLPDLHSHSLQVFSCGLTLFSIWDSCSDEKASTRMKQ